MLAHQSHQGTQLVVIEKRGRAATQVQLADNLALAAMLGMHGDFAAQIVEVLRRFLVMLGDDLVAGAVVAQRLAERHMDIKGQRQRAAAECALRCCSARV